MYEIVEFFTSINGEGPFAGKLALFIRFKGCNLNCSYCDTKWANVASAPFNSYSLEQIVDLVRSSKVKHVTLTGGEPLTVPHLGKLLEALSQEEDVEVEIETNGSIAIQSFSEVTGKKPRFTVDYKTPSSGENEKMFYPNYSHLSQGDVVKCVVGSMLDLEAALALYKKYEIKEMYLSPVFGQIEAKAIVEFMKAHDMVDARLQIQLHKIIWHPEERGV